MVEVTQEMIEAGAAVFADIWETRELNPDGRKTVAYQVYLAMKAKEPKRHETQLAQAMREMTDE